MFLRYGYVDADGEVREYKYTSGIPCDGSERTRQPSRQPDTTTRKTGYYDYGSNRFVLPDGRKVKVVINDSNKARG